MSNPNVELEEIENENYKIISIRGKDKKDNNLGLDLDESKKFLVIKGIKVINETKVDSILTEIEDDIKGKRIIMVNDEYVSNIKEFEKEISKENNIKIKIVDLDFNIYKSQRIPFTFLDLLIEKYNYQNTKDEKDKDKFKHNFINILTRCKYKVCLTDKIKVMKKFKLKNFTVKLNNLKNFYTTLNKTSLLTNHTHINFYDPVYEINNSFGLYASGDKCSIRIPDNNYCTTTESNWFYIKMDDLNLNIKNLDFNFQKDSCNIKGELFRFLWKYIDKSEFILIDTDNKNRSLITNKLYDYRENIYTSEQKYSLKNAFNKTIKNIKLGNPSTFKESIINYTLITKKNPLTNIIIYLPYPEIKYSKFGMGLSKNYRKNLNCRLFADRMFGSKIINNLNYINFDMNTFNHARLDLISKPIKNIIIKKNNNNKLSPIKFKNDKIKKELILVNKYKSLKNKNINIDNLQLIINNNNELNPNNLQSVKDSLKLNKSKPKNRYKVFESMIQNDLQSIQNSIKPKMPYSVFEKKKKNHMLKHVKNKLNKLFIEPKIKKELYNKFEKKIKKKSMLNSILKMTKNDADQKSKKPMNYKKFLIMTRVKNILRFFSSIDMDEEIKIKATNMNKKINDSIDYKLLVKLYTDLYYILKNQDNYVIKLELFFKMYENKLNNNKKKGTFKKALNYIKDKSKKIKTKLSRKKKIPNMSYSQLKKEYKIGTNDPQNISE
tara:strand:- start:2946 stop:5105 length:2160 start_codon:yes stop_codon:yes gene_type:complete